MTQHRADVHPALVGYTDRLSAAPGDTIRFMVSSQHPSYRADLVRLIHGDTSPDGPGFKEHVLESPVNGEHPGRVRDLLGGSYVRVPDDPQLRLTGSFTIATWIWPTVPQAGRQGVLARWADGVGGYALVLEDGGDLALWLGSGSGQTQVIRTGVPLVAHRWYFVGATVDADRRTARVFTEPLQDWPIASTRVAAETELSTGPDAPDGVDVTIGRVAVGPGEPEDGPGGNFNGKIEAPVLADRVLTADELSAIRNEGPAAARAVGAVGAWDFADGPGGARVADVSGHGLHGEAVNIPVRAVRGHNWTGREMSFRAAPAEYGAIHFHSDDLEDPGWEPDFELTIPAGLPSGVYAARLSQSGDEEYLPFVVRPPRGTATADIAVLMPTVSYVIYANFLDLDGGCWDPASVPNADASLHAKEFRYVLDNRLYGLYDVHFDGASNCMTSSLRPILNMRPKFRYRVWSAPARFPADLYLIDWLDHKGFAADVITDHDLHAEGADLLSRYRVVITGSHHEYWTEPMLDAIQQYLGSGGRVMYLGGNSFFGVTTIDPDRPHVHEVRRWGTSWPFEMPPGERYHATTGEPGGTWRNRGRPPQQLVGVGSSSAGFDTGAPYLRQPDSFDPRAAFIFAGVGDNERIGDTPSLMVGHGAGGYEQDRLDFGLGTPAHALLLASTAGQHSAAYGAFIDEILDYPSGIDGVLPDSKTQPGVPHPFVRSDMVFFETPHGGAVFAAAAICFRGCLSWNGYDNAASRVTENVLRRFCDEEPLA
jgi:N,N-dimethylformamidase